MPRIDLMAAKLAQERHEFDVARRLLGRVLAVEPQNVEALLMRANIGILVGDFDAGRRDCLSVLRAGTLLPGTVCLASTMTGRGSLERARRLMAALESAGPAPPVIAQWRLATEADLALRAGDARAALLLLERAHASDPANDEVRARLAELLLAERQSARALAVTNGPGASLARLVVRLRAAEALGDPRAAAMREEIEDVLEVAHRRGAVRHDREEAVLALHVDGDARRALAHARRNFANQKDTPDLRLLVDAALAAGDRESLSAVRAWLTATGFQDRVVDARLREAGA